MEITFNLRYKMQVKNSLPNLTNPPSPLILHRKTPFFSRNSYLGRFLCDKFTPKFKSPISKSLRVIQRVRFSTVVSRHAPSWGGGWGTNEARKLGCVNKKKLKMEKSCQSDYVIMSTPVSRVIDCVNIAALTIFKYYKDTTFEKKCGKL